MNQRDLPLTNPCSGQVCATPEIQASSVRGDAPLTKAEVLVALSRALDIRGGQPPGHAVRTCHIAMRIARELRLSPTENEDLYFASLLKDAGCGNDTARIHFLFNGDQELAKRHIKRNDWRRMFSDVAYELKYGESEGIWDKWHCIKNILHSKDSVRHLAAMRCVRGATIARTLGFTPAAAEAIRDIDEHWNGKGIPRRLRGEQISPITRILCLAQTLEVFATTFGVAAAYRMLYRRKRTWFDPEVVQVCESFRTDEVFWSEHVRRVQHQVLTPPLSATAFELAEAGLDSVCEAFAMMEDAKSSSTWEHSTRVTEYALEIGEAFGFSKERLCTLRRAALLHDIGKLGVSNTILDKPERLTDEEFSKVKLHPRFTWEILSSIRGFRRVAEIASAHHERLDGSGYWRGWAAGSLDLDMRILAVADVFDALSADRPYRKAMPMEKVFAILEKESQHGLDPMCVAVLRELHFRSQPKLLTSKPLPSEDQLRAA